MKTKKELQFDELKQATGLMRDSGGLVYCILRHVSQSGMNRIISFFVIVDNEVYYLDYYISMLSSYKQKRNGLSVTGCGMDMGFHVIDNFRHGLMINETVNIRWI